MKLAIFSDIHGNPFALEAVLRSLAAEAVDQLVCLGDVALDGPDPRATLALLRQLDCVFVMGNTDLFALEPVSIQAGESPIFHAIDLWSAGQLGDNDRAFIRTFQPTVTLELERGQRICCYHGSPTSCHEIILPTMSDAELETKLGHANALLFAGGHVHQQYVRRWQQRIVLNPGSVGLPYELLPNGDAVNPWRAEYALVSSKDGELRVELRRQVYDAQSVIDGVLASDMPYKEEWAEGWIAFSTHQTTSIP